MRNVGDKFNDMIAAEGGLVWSRLCEPIHVLTVDHIAMVVTTNLSRATLRWYRGWRS